MVLIYTTANSFDYPWEMLTRAIFNKYPNPFAAHVKSSDFLSVSVKDNILSTTRIFLKQGKLPSWGAQLISIPEAFIVENSTVDLNTKTMTTSTKNLSHKKLMLVEETQIYTPDPNDSSRTLVKTEAKIISNTGWLIGSRIEGFGLNNFKTNLQKSTKGILHVLNSIHAKNIANSNKSADNKQLKKKPVSFSNLAIGAGLNMFEISTLGQPFEVIKTQMAAKRADTMPVAIKTIWSRGGILGFYQGLIPWGWFEACTKGSVLLFATSELEYHLKKAQFSPAFAGIVGGMGGGIAQAYLTMGFCTFMKTVEITRAKGIDIVKKSSIQIARDIIKKEGIMGINKGVNAVALRQMTNWGSRFGISRIIENLMLDFSNRNSRMKNGDTPKALESYQKILASALAGALSCWNQPIEVIRVEMQSQLKTAGRPEKMTIAVAAKWIYEKNGLKGFYRGITPRIGLGIWQTVCMVFGGDQLKKFFKT